MNASSSVTRMLSVVCASAEHLRRVVEGRERRRLAGHALLQQVVRHLLLQGGLDVALVVVREVLEERRRVDDVPVRRDGERLGDLRGDQDLDVAARRRPAVLPVRVGDARQQAEARHARSGRRRLRQKCAARARIGASRHVFVRHSTLLVRSSRTLRARPSRSRVRRAVGHRFGWAQSAGGAERSSTTAGRQNVAATTPPTTPTATISRATNAGRRESTNPCPKTADLGQRERSGEPCDQRDRARLSGAVGERHHHEQEERGAAGEEDREGHRRECDPAHEQRPEPRREHRRDRYRQGNRSDQPLRAPRDEAHAEAGAGDHEEPRAAATATTTGRPRTTRCP